MMQEKNKKVLCASCKKPIHIDDLGLITGKNGVQKWYHDNYVCLLERQMEIKSSSQLNSIDN